MTGKPAEFHHAERVEELLHKHDATHVRARKHGAAVLVESKPKCTSVKHFRIRRETVHLWMLDMANHRGKWQRTPFRASIDELAQMVLDDFPCALSAII